MKQMRNFEGYLFAKLFFIGTKSEGPAYYLQQWDYKEVHVVKKVNSWEEDPELRKFLNRKVTIEGAMAEEGIEYGKVSELVHLVNEKKKLELHLQVPEKFWVNKMPGPGPIKHFFPILLTVEWPYRSIWQGTCPTSQLFDFTIEKNGCSIWKWSSNKFFLQTLTPLVIPGGKPIEYAANWEFKANEIKEEGTYIAKAQFIASNQVIEKKFEIKFAY